MLTHDDGPPPIAISHLSDSGDLKLMWTHMYSWNQPQVTYPSMVLNAYDRHWKQQSICPSHQSDPKTCKTQEDSGTVNASASIVESSQRVYCRYSNGQELNIYKRVSFDVEHTDLTDEQRQLLLTFLKSISVCHKPTGIWTSQYTTTPHWNRWRFSDSLLQTITTWIDNSKN